MMFSLFKKPGPISKTNRPSSPHPDHIAKVRASSSFESLWNGLVAMKYSPDSIMQACRMSPYTVIYPEIGAGIDTEIDEFNGEHQTFDQAPVVERAIFSSSPQLVVGF